MLEEFPDISGLFFDQYVLDVDVDVNGFFAK